LNFIFTFIYLYYTIFKTPKKLMAKKSMIEREKKTD
jgi:hypothetical protein